MKRVDLRHRYLVQRGDAKRRGIGFELTYDEWLDIWISSGHLHERGRRRGQYVMARFGDRGSYAVDNVKIVTTEANLSESNRGKTLTPEHRKRIGASSLGNKYWLGRRHTAETKNKMREARLRWNQNLLSKD